MLNYHLGFKYFVICGLKNVGIFTIKKPIPYKQLSLIRDDFFAQGAPRDALIDKYKDYINGKSIQAKLMRPYEDLLKLK